MKEVISSIELKNIFNQYLKELSEFCSKPIQKLNFVIDCSKLSLKYLEENIIISGDFVPIFDALNVCADSKEKPITKDPSRTAYNEYPCVYWFDSDVELVGAEVYKALENRDRADVVIPAKNKQPHNSKCLYVGKVNANIAGRLIQHLGVHKNQTTTHGLQLVHWEETYKNKLTLNFHVVPLGIKEDSQEEVKVSWGKIAMLFEYVLADKLKPILGHHNG